MGVAFRTTGSLKSLPLQLQHKGKYFVHLLKFFSVNTPLMVTELITYPYWMPCFLSITHAPIFPGTLK